MITVGGSEDLKVKVKLKVKLTSLSLSLSLQVVITDVLHLLSSTLSDQYSLQTNDIPY